MPHGQCSLVALEISAGVAGSTLAVVLRIVAANPKLDIGELLSCENEQVQAEKSQTMSFIYITQA